MILILNGSVYAFPAGENVGIAVTLATAAGVELLGWYKLSPE